MSILPYKQGKTVKSNIQGLHRLLLAKFCIYRQAHSARALQARQYLGVGPTKRGRPQGWAAEGEKKDLWRNLALQVTAVLQCQTCTPHVIIYSMPLRPMCCCHTHLAFCLQRQEWIEECKNDLDTCICCRWRYSCKCLMQSLFPNGHRKQGKFCCLGVQLCTCAGSLQQCSCTKTGLCDCAYPWSSHSSVC